MTGAATFSTTNFPPLAPGAMAEHLTSFGAAFDQIGQTKVTEWLKVGAAASAGTVLEPRAIWTKFPHARYFVHAANGCSVLESFIQSIASPLETLLLGDPLCRPWASPIPVVAVDLSDLEPDADHLVVGVQVLGTANAPRTMLRVFLDGREFQPEPAMPMRLPTRDLADGYHELRVVAYSGIKVFRQGFATLDFQVDYHGRSVELHLPERDTPYLTDQQLQVAARCSGEPERLELLANGQVVATSEKPKDPLLVELASVGRGPSQLQLRATYPDGMQVLSAPVSLTVD